MKTIGQNPTRLALTGLLLGLLTACLVGCGGGGGGKEPVASGQQGIQFTIDKNYNQMVYSIDATGPNGTTKHTVGLSPGQEMFFSMPPGNYQLDYWIHAGGGISVRDLTPRYATVQPSQVTRVTYP